MAGTGLLALAAVASAQPAPRGKQPQAAQESADAKRRVDDAKKLHDEARDLYDAGEYRKAIAKLEQALALDPEGKELLYNLGLIYEKLTEVDAAERYYRKYLEMETDPPLVERTQRALKRIEGARKELEERKRPPPAAAQPTKADAPKSMSRPIRPWVWITGGVAFSALIVGNVFAISAVAKSPGDDARTGDGVGVADLQADADAAHDRAIVADISFLAALLAGGAAAYLYLSTPRRPDVSQKDAATRLNLAAAAGRGSVRVRF